MRLPHRLRKRCVLAAAVLSSHPLAIAPGAVLHVGPTRAYTSIQQAVDAAAPGDLILVDRGSYAPFDILGKGVTVLGADGPFTLTPSSTRPVIAIANVPAGESVTVMGWRTAVAFGAAPALDIRACAGAVRIADAVLDPTADLVDVPMLAVAEIRGCASVALYDVRIDPAAARNGRTTNGVPAGSGVDRGLAAVLAQGSKVHLSRCVLRGYDNLGTPSAGRWGGDGLRLRGGSRARLDDAPSRFQGGAGGEFGGSAVQLIAGEPVLDLRTCGLPGGAAVPGPGPKPGGHLSINHDRGFSGGAVRLLPVCLHEAMGRVDMPSRLPIASARDIVVSSRYPRLFWLYVGPTGFRMFPGVGNTAYLDYASPATVLVAAGELAVPPVAVVRLVLPDQPALVGLQLAAQAVLGPPGDLPAPVAAFSLGEIFVITP